MSGSNGTNGNGKPPSKQGKNKGGIPPIEHRWKPGQSGNPNGRPKGRTIEPLIRKLLDGGTDDINDAKAIAERMVELAKNGDFRYAKEIIDRLDGKPVDRSESDGKLEITVRYVDKPVTHGIDRD